MEVQRLRASYCESFEEVKAMCKFCGFGTRGSNVGTNQRRTDMFITNKEVKENKAAFLGRKSRCFICFLTLVAWCSAVSNWSWSVWVPLGEQPSLWVSQSLVVSCTFLPPSSLSRTCFMMYNLRARSDQKLYNFPFQYKYNGSLCWCWW